MHPRLFRLLETYQRIDDLLRRAQRHADRSEISRLTLLKTRAKHLIQGVTASPSGIDRSLKVKPNGRWVTMPILATAATLALAACGDVPETATELGTKVDGAIEQQAAARAIVESVDVETAKGLAADAAKEALGDALPVEEAAVAAALVDEQALVDGLDKAVNGDALRDAVTSAATQKDGKSAVPTAD